MIETVILSPFLVRAYNNTNVEISNLEFISQFGENLELELNKATSLEALPFAIVSVFAVSLVTLFFNAAIVECLNLSLNGEKSTFFKSISNTFRNLKNIVSYSLIDTTFKVLFKKASEGSAGLLSAIGLSLIGIGWYYANWFAMPILITEGKGPIESIKKSAALFKSKFSEQIISEFSLGIIFLPFYLLSFVPVLVFGLGMDIEGPDFKINMLFMIAISLIAAMIVHVFSSASSQILKLLVYRKAMEEQRSEVI